MRASCAPTNTTPTSCHVRVGPTLQGRLALASWPARQRCHPVMRAEPGAALSPLDMQATHTDQLTNAARTIYIQSDGQLLACLRLV